MKAAATVKPHSAKTVSIKLDSIDRERIAALAAIKKRAPHYLMKEAIVEYIQREEVRQNFILAAETAFDHYQQTGRHITLDELSTWVDETQKTPDTPVPLCHT
jgi:predicted transcriptional regulator